ncbi:MAG: hypothetical protein Q9227_002439 [Pyrenula ochraceoflavens]
MTRRILRTGLQLGSIVAFVLLLLFFLDNRLDVLPTSIHNHLPQHHPGFVVTDITVSTCSTLNIFSSCKLDQEKWQRVEKDLFLGKGFMSKAYLHVQRKKEEELLPSDKVVMDVKISRADPSASETKNENFKWESKPAGLWVKKSSKRHTSDSAQAITAVDVLFGPDAADPRANWQVMDLHLLLGYPAGAEDARLTFRRGSAGKTPNATPRVRKEGKFKIMQAADLHLSTGLGKCRDELPAGHNGGKCDADPRTLEFVERVIDEEKPDLVVLSGDQIVGEGHSPDAQTALFKIAALLAQKKIPYATIFGNHDDEDNLPRSAQMDLLADLPYSHSRAGPPDVAGIGNYFVEVLGRGTTHHSALTLYFLDSHSNSPDERQFRGYDWIKPTQISWFHQTAQSLKKKHKEYTHIHMDLAFMHIPLPEIRNPDGFKDIVGNWSEPPTAPGFNSGFKDALVEEGVVLVGFGHDHVNDYCLPGSNAETKQPALWMCYGGGAGFGGYGRRDWYHRRIRFYDIDMNEARITTYKRLEWGTEKRIDEQTIVDAGKVIVKSQ